MTSVHLPTELRQIIERALESLADVRDHGVVVGGLAKIFYEYHPDFVVPPVLPRATVDLDIALSRKAMDMRHHLHDRLIRNDLVPFMVPDFEGRPSEMQYQRIEDGTERRADSCLEFITPYGGASLRQLTHDHALLPNALRYVEMLLINPVKVELPG